MVAAGVTTALVPVTVPTPWLTLSVVAPVTDHARVLLWPAVMAAGVAVKVEMTGFGREAGAATVSQRKVEELFVPFEAVTV